MKDSLCFMNVKVMSALLYQTTDRQSCSDISRQNQKMQIQKVLQKH